MTTMLTPSTYTYVDSATYREFMATVVLALQNYQIKHYVNDEYYSAVYGQNSTLIRLQTIAQLRTDDQAGPGNDFNVPHYNERRKFFERNETRMNQLRNEIISKLSPATKGSLYVEHQNPSIPQILDFVSEKYGVITTTEKLKLQQQLSDAIT